MVVFTESASYLSALGTTFNSTFWNGVVWEKTNICGTWIVLATYICLGDYVCCISTSSTPAIAKFDKNHNLFRRYSYSNFQCVREQKKFVFIKKKVLDWSNIAEHILWDVQLLILCLSMRGVGITMLFSHCESEGIVLDLLPW